MFFIAKRFFLSEAALLIQLAMAFHSIQPKSILITLRSQGKVDNEADAALVLPRELAIELPNKCLNQLKPQPLR